MSILLIFSIIILLYLITVFCEIFTNAVEHLGIYYKIQDGALGSIFAAVGTALPETILPLIAVFGAYITGSSIDLGKEIGKGAILGSPFMLSSLAFFLVAFWVCIMSFAKKRSYDMNIDTIFFRRDLKFFAIAYTIGIMTVFIPHRLLQITIGLMLLVYYMIYAVRTIKKHSCCDGEYCENKCEELTFFKIIRADEKYRVYLIFIQFFVSILGLVISSHFFVENIKEIASILGISAMIISLFLAPVATELPETINGMVWSSQNKDILAVSNITGAMVFQACIPMAIGIFFTNWTFSFEAAVNVLSVYFAFCILLFASRKQNNVISSKVLLLSSIPYLFYLLFSLFRVI